MSSCYCFRPDRNCIKCHEESAKRGCYGLSVADTEGKYTHLAHEISELVKENERLSKECDYLKRMSDNNMHVVDAWTQYADRLQSECLAWRNKFKEAECKIGKILNGKI